MDSYYHGSDNNQVGWPGNSYMWNPTIAVWKDFDFEPLQLHIGTSFTPPTPPHPAPPSGPTLTLIPANLSASHLSTCGLPSRTR